MVNIVDVLRFVYDKVIPSDDERRRVESVVSIMIERVKKASSQLNLPVKVRAEGSIAKDTWISGDRDIDIFIQLPREIGVNGLREIGLRIARIAAGDRWIERYAEHPYIETELNDFKIDLVPCFMLNDPREALSTVDRTPFHTDFINSLFNDVLRRETRVLKQFMKGIGVYGAEIKVQGFSGYLCELLILHYGSFLDLIEAAAERWRPFNVVIDIKEYHSNLNEVKSIFNAPLIVIDPVDKRRNVAAALSLEKICEFIAACRAFLKRPDVSFFFPSKLSTFTSEELVNQFRVRGTDFIFIITSCPKAVPDVLWGQLYKSLRGLRRLLYKWNFKVIGDFVWSDEEDKVVFCFELESAFLPNVERHVGPPISSKEHCDKFLVKHLVSMNLISGPKIEGDRWVVYLKRKYPNITLMLMNEWMKAKLGSLVYESLKNGFQVLLNEQIVEFYDSNDDFAYSLTKYLVGRPSWLLAN